MSTLFSNFFQTFFKNFKKVLQPHKSGLNPFFIFWPTRSTLSYSFTLCLVYNGLFSIIISSTLLPKNSPPDCFLNGRLQIPSDSKQAKKRHPVGCHTFILSLLLPEVLCTDLNFPPRLLRPVHSYASINAPP